MNRNSMTLQNIFRTILICVVFMLLAGVSIAQEDEGLEIARQRIANYDASESFLGLSDLGLETIPEELWELENIEMLHLSGNNLTELPPEIGTLTNLRTLSLRTNSLTELPPEIGNLTNLTTLMLEENSLTELPSEIGNLSNLQMLNAGDNLLTSLPPEIGNLSNLTTLSISRNALTELPPEIGNLSNLTTLSFSGNILTELPPEIGNLSNLTTLSFSRNALTELPPEIGNLSNLQILNADDNLLTSLPPEIGNLTSIQELNLEDNEITTLPVELASLLHLLLLPNRPINLRGNPLDYEYGNTWELFLILRPDYADDPTVHPTYLRILNVILDIVARDVEPASFHYNYSGLSAIPPEIGLLTSITSLRIEGGNFTELPPEIGNLTNLEELYIGNNQLTTLPPEIGNLTDLTIIDAHGNLLRELPDELGNLVNLHSLDLSNNQISTVSDSFSNLVSITKLNFGSNQFTEIPSVILELPGFQPHVGFICVVECDRSRGAILTFENNPVDWFVDGIYTIAPYADIARFALPENEETASLIATSEISYLETVADIERVGGEAFGIDIPAELDQLPPELFELTELQSLYIHSMFPQDTTLLSEISLEIGDLGNLSSLIITDTAITRLPPEIGELTNLEFLILNGNQLGSLPPEIGQLSNLEFLIIADNQLSTLPAEVGNLQNLRMLYLMNNQITDLPDELWQLPALEMLVLNGNPISELPPEIEQLDSLRYIDVRNTNLTTLPVELTYINAFIYGECSDIYRELNQTRYRDSADIENNNNYCNSLLTDGLPMSYAGQDARDVFITLRPEVEYELSSSYQHAQNVISTVSANDGLELHLERIAIIPPELLTLTQLEILTIEGGISELPEGFETLSNLRVLRFTDANFTEFPLAILELENLETLQISANLRELPPEISQLTQLTSLDLSGNQFIRVPRDVYDLPNLCNLGLGDNPLLIGQGSPDFSNTCSYTSYNNPALFPLPFSRQAPIAMLIVAIYVGALWWSRRDEISFGDESEAA